ncbi:hypothetical protein PHYSODRAFT_535396 [Phytophthora sojae]|uniref:Uncharacterized protein n=1 Tax=Phytophthora sojae (strain P6497) TaxID=1094619 RepID=G5AI15_PHYSP|nr:hypothetical protein PHYSODRAFT_535418 [Phytophthora sojae]XP_009539687.1 hypothetical protein PHYSODRAFT_535396 [Phytophthora sojae]EGZ04844.1 hypothetical protein PHYSODRAFT_535418 [Phytophthora sojae]EGZ04845.1 hypothetical protein PHYSODRAFT_535396 [Phytophthora sojae]|eukprot:XP_009539686.1 hypothetical protein PHYSODRAFT_535418 [Phytophthora sojae]
MTSTIDPRAFAIAIELANQLSSDGAFVDERNSNLSGKQHVYIPSNDDIAGDSIFDEGSLALQELIPGSVMDILVEGATTQTMNSSAVHGLARHSSWWSLIERIEDITEEDLLVMEW